MINVKLICTGNLKEGYLREAYSEYAKRLGGMCRFETVELKEYKLPENPSDTEIATALEEEGKRILFSGCSHKGVVNIARHFSPDILVGGFHFKNMTEELFLEDAADALAAIPARYYTCHCTGKEQYDFLKKKMPNQLHYLSAGQTVTI